MGLGREPLFDSFLNYGKEPLHLGKRCLGIVVVIHQAVLVMVALGKDFVNRKTRLLHHCASVLEVSGNFFGCLLESAIETIGLLGCRTLPVICAIPFGRRIENLTSPSHNADVGRAHWGICVGWTAKFRILRAQSKRTADEQPCTSHVYSLLRNALGRPGVEIHYPCLMAKRRSIQSTANRCANRAPGLSSAERGQGLPTLPLTPLAARGK